MSENASITPDTTDHVCTRKCLRFSASFGIRFYYCALTEPVRVTIPRRRP